MCYIIITRKGIFPLHEPCHHSVKKEIIIFNIFLPDYEFENRCSNIVTTIFIQIIN